MSYGTIGTTNTNLYRLEKNMSQAAQQQPSPQPSLLQQPPAPMKPAVSPSTETKQPSPQPHTLLVNDIERKELEDFCANNKNFEQLLKSPDDICHALKVISSLEGKERFSTSTGFYIQPSEEWFVWLKRWVYGDDRATNMKAIKCLFIATFTMIDQCLQEREVFVAASTREHNPERIDTIQRMKNSQLIERLTKYVVDASGGLDKLKETYKDDTHTKARIDTLSSNVNDRLQLIKTSLGFLDAQDLLAKPLFTNIVAANSPAVPQVVPNQPPGPSAIQSAIQQSAQRLSKVNPPPAKEK